MESSVLLSFSLPHSSSSCRDATYEWLVLVIMMVVGTAFPPASVSERTVVTSVITRVVGSRVGATSVCVNIYVVEGSSVTTRVVEGSTADGVIMTVSRARL